MERYLAMDPGMSTGYAYFDEQGDIMDYGTIKGRSGLYEFMEHAPSSLETLVLEDYKLYPWKTMQQSWSTLDTVRFIGALEYWANKRLMKVVLQPPNIKNIAYMWAGIKKPKNHDLTHETDAYVHGVYYLQKEGIRKPQQSRGEQ